MTSWKVYIKGRKAQAVCGEVVGGCISTVLVPRTGVIQASGRQPKPLGGCGSGVKKSDNYSKLLLLLYDLL